MNQIRKKMKIYKVLMIIFFVLSIALKLVSSVYKGYKIFDIGIAISLLLTIMFYSICNRLIDKIKENSINLQESELPLKNVERRFEDCSIEELQEKLFKIREMIQKSKDLGNSNNNQFSFGLLIFPLIAIGIVLFFVI